jgi:hypothetical protein
MRGEVSSAAARTGRFGRAGFAETVWGASVRVTAAASALVASLLASRAGAYEARIEASLDAQYYSLRSPFGQPYLSRRRYTSTLGLNLDQLEGASVAAKRGGPRLWFRSRLRVDADFGQEGAERDPRSNRFIPGLGQAPLDLMYGYLEGRGFAGGLVGFRLGRQYAVDALGYWSFDGAEVELTLPVHLALSGFAGFEQRPGLPTLSAGRFGAEGVWRGNRDGLELGQYPAFLEESALAPAAGAALEIVGLQSFHSKLSYRKVQNRSAVLVSPFFDGASELRVYRGARTSSERVGYSARVDLAALGATSVQAVYDLYNQRLSDATLDLDVYAAPSLSIGADLDYYYPTFDGDSIFNWFTHHGMTTAEGRVSYVPRGPVDVALSSGLRWFDDTGRDVLASASGRYRFGVGSVALDFSAEYGEIGHRVGGGLTTRRVFEGGRYDALVSASAYDWDDTLRPTRSATSFSYVLGGGVRPGTGFISRGRLGFEWEQTMNRLVGQRFRLLATVDFTVLQ